MRNLLFLSFFMILSSVYIHPQTKPEEWKTYFEKSDYLSTSSYIESIEYFQKLINDSPFGEMFVFGKTPQGRDLNCIILSKDRAFTVDKIKALNKPILMIMNGIHAGEIEGKDACMLLLRDILITKEKEQLLDNCVLMIIPVFNVDGHERISPFNRINQNGPTEMGWRTTAQNLNLNRDFMKADSPEMKAFLKLFNTWLPDFFIDTHTTDGADYQYSITYAIEKYQNVLPNTAEWIINIFIPFLEKDVEDQGFLIMPYIDFKEGDIYKGLLDWVTPPRFSHGYLAVQNRPGLLLETHMLKPYKERVFVTLAAITSTLKIINEQHDVIVKLNRDADKQVIEKYTNKKEQYPVSFEFTDEFSKRNFKGIESVIEDSWITGGKIIRYTGKKLDTELPFFDKPVVTGNILVPDYYNIPKEFNNLVDILNLHGVKVEQAVKGLKAIVERYKFSNVKFPQRSFEGRLIPQFEYHSFIDTIEITAGDFIIPTNQRTLRIIVNLLEPELEDSFVKWGFMNSIFEQKEYFEEYSMEPIAQKIADENPNLKEEFLKRLENDEKFRNNSRQRLGFFYERSPYFDKQLNVYPVMRIINIYD